MVQATPRGSLHRMQSLPGLQDTNAARSRFCKSRCRQDPSVSAEPSRSRRELASPLSRQSLLTSSMSMLTGIACATKRSARTCSPSNSNTKAKGGYCSPSKLEPGSGGLGTRKLILGAPRPLLRTSRSCNVNSATSQSPRGCDIGIRASKSKQELIGAVRDTLADVKALAARSGVENIDPMAVKEVTEHASHEKICGSAGPMTAREQRAVASGMVSARNVFRFRQRTAPLLHDLNGAHVSALWKRRQAARPLQAVLACDLCLLLGGDMRKGLSSTIARMLSAHGAWALACCSPTLHALVWRNIEPQRSELHSRKTRRAARAAATAAAVAQRFDEQQALQAVVALEAKSLAMSCSPVARKLPPKRSPRSNSPKPLLYAVPSPQRPRYRPQQPRHSPRVGMRKALAASSPSLARVGGCDLDNERFNANAGRALFCFAFELSAPTPAATRSKLRSARCGVMGSAYT